MSSRNGWQRAKIGDFCEVTSSKRTYAKDIVDHGVPFYRSKEVIELFNGQRQFSNPLFITEERYEGIKKKFGVPQIGDVMITSRGTLGIPLVVKDCRPFYFADGNLSWFKDLDGIDPFLLYYWLLSPSGKAQLQKCTIGSSQQAYTIVQLKEMEIHLPPLPAQQKIASILSAYDDLIENNTRRIAILEEMAQAIYREWFVNFRFPGHENVKFVDSPLGQIPNGWEVVAFDKLLLSMGGGDWGNETPTDDFVEEVSVIRGTDFDDVKHGGKLRVPVRYIKASSLRTRRIQRGDIIVENSVNAKSRSVGSTLLVNDKTLHRFSQPVIAASFCKLFRFKQQLVAPIAHLHMQQLRIDGKMEFYQNTAANGIGNFQATRFESEETMVLPNDGVTRQRLSSHVSQLFEFIATLSAKVSNLRTTRDLLLPKLISGQLDVEDLDIDLGTMPEVLAEATT